MSENTLIASEDRKNREIIRQCCEVVLNECGFDEDQKQRIVEAGGALQIGFKELVTGLAVPQEYANEEVTSSFVYPREYKQLSVRAQVERLLVHFPNLNVAWALEHGQGWYDGLSVPKWIEGPLVYIWWEALGSYNAALEGVLTRLADTRAFQNYRSGRIGSNHLRQTELTARSEALLKAGQPGDLLIVPSQAGYRFRGKSVCRGRVLFTKNEFGSGAVAEGCRALTHSERDIRWEQLHTDCPGDEYAPGDDGQFSSAPIFCFGVGKLEFGTYPVGIASGRYGSASSVLPQ